MGIQILFIENHKNPHIDALCEDFLRKTRGIFSFSLVKIAGSKSLNPEEQKKKETQSIEKLVKPLDVLILCDERGTSYTSPAFTQFLEQRLAHNRGNILIAIGGAYGFTEEARQQYPSWKLSDLVFPHHIARLLVAEQLYRSSQIAKGSGYHHE